MIKNHIYNILLSELDFTPTAGQAELAGRLAGFIADTANSDSIFILKGYAGTGKTTMVALLVKVLGRLSIRTVLMAPTGRAAKVLGSYTRQPAFTIHKKIYRQVSSSDGMGRFVLDKNLYKNTIFIVDEASMVANFSGEGNNFGSGRLLDDLLEFVYSGGNCRLILVGDTAQLPPVGLDISPALDLAEMEQYGFGLSEFVLEDVVRQTKESGILLNATNIRSRVSTDDSHSGFFRIELVGFDDIFRISGEDLIEAISECYDRYGLFETAIVTRSNKRANQFNQGIRNTILCKEGEIARGDLLMAVKNNYFWVGDNEEMDFIANGDIAEIAAIYRYEELYGFRFADVRLRFIDYKEIELDCKIMLDTLNLESASLNEAGSRRLFDAVSEDYAEIKNKRNRWEKIRENPHFNALQVKFAYAVTCHKAQGGQWKAVFIDHGYLAGDMLNKEYLRWMYTAFTRPTEKLYLVNFNKHFFEDE